MNEEGLQKTDNELIYIGKPINFDEDKFKEELKELYEEAHDETKDVRLTVQKIVRTYQIKEDLLRKLETIALPETSTAGKADIVDIKDRLEKQSSVR